MHEFGDVLLVDGEVGHVDAVLAQAPRVLATMSETWTLLILATLVTVILFPISKVAF